MPKGDIYSLFNTEKSLKSFKIFVKEVERPSIFPCTLLSF